MRLRFRPVLSALLLALVLTPAAGADADLVGSIVQIETTFQEPSFHQPWKMQTQSTRTGSGCIIAGGRILTNAHVVSDETFIQVRRAGEAKRYVAEVAAVSHELDLALLKVPSKAFFEGTKSVAIGDLPAIGDTVTALGFPEGGTRITITEGIVSRIDRGQYSHSYFDNLTCQIDAAINSGSSGGPVLAGGKIVGVAFQTGHGENIGYVIPVPVVKHFLADLEDGRHDGVPGVVFAWQALDNEQMRRTMRIPEDETGILVTRIAPRFAGDDKMKAHDVLLTIDGFDVAGDGTIATRPGERITFRWAIDRKQVGEALPLRVLRDGQVKEVILTLDAAKRGYGNLVPRRLYDVRPTYYILGGLVFSPLTMNYYDAWDSWSDVPINLKRYYYESRTAENEERQEIVVMIDYLPDELNVCYDFEDSIVSMANGKKINSMRDLVEAIESHQGDDHRIVFEDNGWEVVFERSVMEKRGPSILARYGVPADRSTDLK